MSLIDGFNFENLKKMSQVGLKTRLTFGKYKGETIESIVSFDASYIMYLYDTNTINPDSELLKLIHMTEKYAKEEEKNEWFDKIF